MSWGMGVTTRTLVSDFSLISTYTKDGINLMKKAREYSRLCEADVCVGIRVRETGQVFILSADASGFWGFLGSQVVCRQKQVT
ncbi:Transcription factor MADS-box [Penicillium brevicompactum]|uniref:Transcription factor MADS-box n=1 Tax=Penicillium brevicompactum TaxID=5074 RepID=UPI00253FC726|nr:Transcription factor MADS-box [Penicillium brevicompactum]KAJ5346770.1 Transcription factor MADS-box [Penicillium brevicompactum]